MNKKNKRPLPFGEAAFCCVPLPVAGARKTGIDVYGIHGRMRRFLSVMIIRQIRKNVD
jgi:hypothetical protein